MLRKPCMAAVLQVCFLHALLLTLYPCSMLQVMVQSQQVVGKASVGGPFNLIDTSGKRFTDKWVGEVWGGVGVITQCHGHDMCHPWTVAGLQMHEGNPKGTPRLHACAASMMEGACTKGWPVGCMTCGSSLHSMQCLFPRSPQEASFFRALPPLVPVLVHTKPSYKPSNKPSYKPFFKLQGSAGRVCTAVLWVHALPGHLP